MERNRFCDLISINLFNDAFQQSRFKHEIETEIEDETKNRF